MMLVMLRISMSITGTNLVPQCQESEADWLVARESGRRSRVGPEGVRGEYTGDSRQRGLMHC